MDAFEASSVTCRNSAGQCDVAESCTGSSGSCPVDGFASSATGCTGASQGGTCDDDASDHCLGTANTCVDAFQPSGTACSDGLGCTISDACDGLGACAGTPKDCSDSNVCTTDVCIEPAGTCDHSTASGACNITGHVYYYRNHMTSTEPSTKPIAGENVHRDSSTEDAPTGATSTTDASGQYGFSSEAGDITLTPAPVRLVTSETECRDAIGASDAAAIARAAVGLDVLTDNQKVAGDVSYNGTVSSFDAALVSQKAVATSCTGYHLPARNATGSDWAFRPVVKNYTPITGNVSFDFAGVMYGDVTGNWNAPAMYTPVEGPTEVEVTSVQQAPGAGGTVTGGAVESGPAVSPDRYPGAALYLASGPSQNADGSWEIVLGLAQSDGILGMDLGLHYDASAIHVLGVTATGVGSSLSAATNDGGSDLRIALYGTAPLQGSGSFLKVTYQVTGPVSGMPFSVAAEANEGLIPIVWSPAIPGGGVPSPRVTVDR